MATTLHHSQLYPTSNTSTIIGGSPERGKYNDPLGTTSSIYSDISVKTPQATSIISAPLSPRTRLNHLENMIKTSISFEKTKNLIDLKAFIITVGIIVQLLNALITLPFPSRIINSMQNSLMSMQRLGN